MGVLPAGPCGFLYERWPRFPDRTLGNLHSPCDLRFNAFGAAPITLHIIQAAIANSPCPVFAWHGAVPKSQNLILHNNLPLIYYSREITIITREKSSCKTWFQVGMELKKVQKQDRDERTQEDYPTSAKIHTRCRVVFLRSFISALLLNFFRLHPYLQIKFYRNFFP